MALPTRWHENGIDARSQEDWNLPYFRDDEREFGTGGLEHHVWETFGQRRNAHDVHQVQYRPHVVGEPGDLDDVFQPQVTDLGFEFSKQSPVAHDVTPHHPTALFQTGNSIQQDGVALGRRETTDHPNDWIIVVPSKRRSRDRPRGFRHWKRESAPYQVDARVRPGQAPQISLDPAADRDEPTAPSRVPSEDLLVYPTFRPGVLQPILAVDSRDESGDPLCSSGEVAPPLRLGVVCVDNSISPITDNSPQRPQEPGVAASETHWHHIETGRPGTGRHRRALQDGD
jgi:hypothetical protein